MKHKSQHDRKVQTKEKILKAAINLFSAKGYYSTNSKEIARVAGVSIGSFYSYFKDKKELLLSIFNSYIEDSLSKESEYFNSSIKRKDAIKLLITDFFNNHHFSYDFYKQITLVSFSDEDVAMIFDEYQNLVLKRISKVLISLEPHISIEAIKIASIIIYSAVEGAIHSLNSPSLKFSKDAIISELVIFIDSYISALGVSSDKC